MSMKMLMVIFWVITPCGLAVKYQHTPPSSALKMETVYPSVGIYRQVYTAQKTIINKVVVLNVGLPTTYATLLYNDLF
jgi:hypothetical protein